MADSAAALRSAGATAAGTTGASIGSLNPSARAPLPPIPNMPLSILIGGDAHSAAHAASAEAASAAAAASAATAAAPAVPAPPTPLHLLPPRDIQQMLDYQARALASLRQSNHNFVVFQEYASRSLDNIHSLHNHRVARVRALRDSLMDVFVRVRHLRMQLAERPGGGALQSSTRGSGAQTPLDPEEAEHAEIEQLKLELRAEEEERRLERAKAAEAAAQEAMRAAAAAAACQSPLGLSSLPTSPGVVTPHGHGGASALVSPAGSGVGAAQPHAFKRAPLSPTEAIAAANAAATAALKSARIELSPVPDASSRRTSVTAGNASSAQGQTAAPNVASTQSSLDHAGAANRSQQA